MCTAGLSLKYLGLDKKMVVWTLTLIFWMFKSFMTCWQRSFGRSLDFPKYTSTFLFARIRFRDVSLIKWNGLRSVRNWWMASKVRNVANIADNYWSCCRFSWLIKPISHLSAVWNSTTQYLIGNKEIRWGIKIFIRTQVIPDLARLLMSGQPGKHICRVESLLPN